MSMEMNRPTWGLSPLFGGVDGGGSWSPAPKLADESPETGAIPGVLWRPEYETGIRRIDDDHKVLLALVNQIHVVVHEGDSTTHVIPHVQRLFDFLIEHFEREENLMELAGYDGLVAHAAAHEQFTHQVGLWHRDLEHDPETLDLDRMASALTDWLIGHILDGDQSFARLQRLADLPETPLFSPFPSDPNA